MSINTNKYGSAVETFVAFDMYNLPMPITPPADLALTANLFSQQYLAIGNALFAGVGSGPACLFDRRDNPFINSFGFFANMADGLVDASEVHSATGFQFGVGIDRLGVSLVGVISNTAGSATVTGNTCFFEQYLAPGMTLAWKDDNGNVRKGIIASVEDDDNLTLTAPTDNTANSMFENPNNSGNSTDTTSKKCFPLVVATPVNNVTGLLLALPTLNNAYGQSRFAGDISFVKPISGQVSFAAAVVGGSNTLAIGTGTHFLTEVVAGQYIRYTPDGSILFITVLVLSVDSDTQLTIKTPAFNVAIGATNIAGVAQKATRVVVGDAADGWMDAFLAVLTGLLLPLAFYTISIDPAYAFKQLMFHVVSEIEHSFPILGGMGP